LQRELYLTYWVRSHLNFKKPIFGLGRYKKNGLFHPMGRGLKEVIRKERNFRRRITWWGRMLGIFRKPKRGSYLKGPRNFPFFGFWHGN